MKGNWLRWGKVFSSLLLLLPTVLMAGEVINTAQLDRGIVHVAYKGAADKRLKVMVQKGDEKYVYNLDATGKQETFPLQLGNGTYQISLLENTVGSKYRVITSETVKLMMNDPNDVYLNPIQNIYWDEQMEAIQYGGGVVGDTAESSKRMTLLHEDLVANYAYDYNKLAMLPTTYLPSIEHTFEVKTGICYDFSALYASWLRSQGIPTKLVKGYTPNAEGYHAWNEAYNEETGEWIVIDTTYDIQVSKYLWPFEMIKPDKDYQKVNEY